MELIDDWGARQRIESRPGKVLVGSRPGSRPAPPPASPEAIRQRLALIEPHVATVHCYEDVGYPWVVATFEHIIGTDVALRVGDALAAVAGADRVYLNSLRPRAVCFVLEPAFGPPPDLPAERYGARLAEIRTAWTRPHARGASSMSAASRRRDAARLR